MSLTPVFQRAVRNHSGVLIAAFAGVALLAALAATRLTIDTSIESMMLRDDPARLLDRELKSDFSNDEILVIAFDLGHAFHADDLRELRTISREIAAVKGVDEVIDLSNVEDVRGRGDVLDASSLVDFATLDGSVASIHERVRGHRLYRSSLASDDLSVLGMVILLDLPAAGPGSSHTTVDLVLEILGERASPWRFYAAGYPMTEYASDRVARRDLLVLTSLAFAVLLTVLYLTTRRWFALGLLAVLVIWTESIVCAWFGLSGSSINAITSVVPTVVLVTASAYAIYLLGLLVTVSDEPEPGVAILRPLTRPVLLAALSTAIGFFSLRFLGMEVLGDLGTSIGVGIAASTLATLLLLPALIHRFHLRLSPATEPWIEAVTGWGVLLARHPWRTVGVATVVLAASVPGIARIRVDTDPVEFFGDESFHTQSAHFIRNHLAGAASLNIVIDTGSPGGALQPSVLGFADGLVRSVGTAPQVSRSVSFIDYFFLMDAAMRPGEEPRTVPPSSALAAQYLILYEAGGDPDDFRHYLNHDRSKLNLVLRMRTRSSAEILKLERAVAALAAHAPDAVEVHVLGTMYLFARSAAQLSWGVVQGLAVALVLIGVVMFVALRSPKLALIAAVPNIAPILVYGGLLGWSGVPLSIGTSLVGCIALGLAVDDTAHVIGHLAPGRTLAETYRVVGRPVLVTTLSLGLGFSVLMLSDFRPIAVLGVATSLTLVVALLADLLLLPSLLVLIGFEPGVPKRLARR